MPGTTKAKENLFALQSSDTAFSALAMGLLETTFYILLQAVTNTVPTNSYLQTIDASVSTDCPKCHQLLRLVLCIEKGMVLLDGGLYTWRQNEVLNTLVTH